MASAPIEILFERKVSAVKLVAIGPVEKDRELDVLHLEHVTYTPAPRGPKRKGTDPSVHIWISEGGNSEVGCSPWGKGGHMIRIS